MQVTGNYHFERRWCHGEDENRVFQRSLKSFDSLDCRMTKEHWVLAISHGMQFFMQLYGFPDENHNVHGSVLGRKMLFPISGNIAYELLK